MVSLSSLSSSNWEHVSVFLNTLELQHAGRLRMTVRQGVLPELHRRKLIRIHRDCWQCDYLLYLRDMIETLATVRTSGGDQWNSWSWEDLHSMLRSFYSHVTTIFNRTCDDCNVPQQKLTSSTTFTTRHAERSLQFIRSLHHHAPRCPRDFVYNVVIYFGLSFEKDVMSTSTSKKSGDEWIDLGVNFKTCPRYWPFLYSFD